MFDNNPSKKNKFDEIMIDIGEQKFRIQVMLGEFIFDILKEFDNHIKDIEIPIPLSIDNKYFTMHCNEIFYDLNNEIVKLKIQEMENCIEWGEIDIFSQEIIANVIHLMYVSEQLYKSFSSENEVH